MDQLLIHLTEVQAAALGTCFNAYRDDWDPEVKVQWTVADLEALENHLYAQDYTLGPYSILSAAQTAELISISDHTVDAFTRDWNLPLNVESEVNSLHRRITGLYINQKPAEGLLSLLGSDKGRELTLLLASLAPWHKSPFFRVILAYQSVVDNEPT